MFKEYGEKWAFQYNEDDFEGQADQFGLYLIKTINDEVSI
jgi:hypothetical protein